MNDNSASSPKFIGDIHSIRSFAVMRPTLRSISVLIVHPQVADTAPEIGGAYVIMPDGGMYPISIIGIGSPDMLKQSFPQEANPQSPFVAIGVVVEALPGEMFLPGMRLEQRSAQRTPDEDLRAIEMRASRQEEILRAALDLVATLGDAMPVEPLLRALENEYRQVRWQAAHLLSRIGARAPLEPFLRLSRDKSTEAQGIRRAAANIFGAHPTEAPVELLVELLQDTNDGSVRSAAAHALGKLGARAPLDALIQALREDKAFGVQASAAQALGELGTLGAQEPIPPLIDALDHPHAWVQEAAAQALLRQRAAVPNDALERAQGILSQKAEMERGWAETERRVMATFERQIEPDTLAGWLNALQHPEWQTRAAAVRRLGTLGAQTPIEPLMTALHDEEQSVAIAVAETLGGLGGALTVDDNMIDQLFTTFDYAGDDLDTATEDAIVALAPWASLNVLLAHVGDTHVNKRKAALKALARHGEEVPVQVVVKAICEIRYMRTVAIETLEQTHPSALAPLVENAIHILMGEPPAFPLDSLIQEGVAQEIGARRMTSAGAIRRVTDLLSWPHWLVRCAALNAFARLGLVLPMETLQRIRALTEDGEAAAVRRAAREALDSMGNPEYEAGTV